MFDPSTYVSPTTLVYRTIRQRILDFQPLVTIKAGNLPDLSNQTFEQFKQSVQPGDLPEAALIQEDFVAKPFGSNSLKSDRTQSFRLFLTIDKLQVTPINNLKDQVFAGLFQLGPDLGLRGMVDDWNIRGGADDAFGQREWKRDTMRYLSALSIVVSMYETRQSLSTFGR